MTAGQSLTAHVDTPSARRFRSPAALALAFVLLGAGLRFYTLGLLRHGYDESFPMYQATQWLDGGILPVTGQPSSVFLDNPVLMTYVQALPLWLWRSIWGPYLLITGLNALATWFVYQAGRKTFGEVTGLVAAFLFAVSPWVIFFSRPAWQPAILPLLTAVIIWGLLPPLEHAEPRPGAVLAAGLALTAMVQMSTPAWGLLAAVAPIVVAFWRRYPRQPLVIGLAVFGIAGAVYALGIPARWPGYLERFQTLGASSRVELSPTALLHAVRLVTGLDSEFIRIWSDLSPQDPRHVATLAASYLLGAALLAGVVRAVWAIWRREHGRPALALLLWFGLPVVLLSASPVTVHPHYLLITLPAGHLLAGWGAAWLLEQPRLAGRAIRWAAGGALALIGGVFALNVHYTGQYVASMTMQPDFNGWPLNSDAALGQTIRELSAGESYPRRVAAAGQSANLSSISATYIETYPELDYPDFVLLPGHEPLLYVLADRRLVPGALGPHEQAFPERAASPALGVEVAFVRANPYSREEALRLVDTPVQWPTEAGLTLLGYTAAPLDPPGRRGILLTTLWRVEQLDPARNDWYASAFYHLVKDGQQVVNHSGHGQNGYRWLEGDNYLEHVALELPEGSQPGLYSLEFGLFDPIHGRSFRFLTPQGTLDAFQVTFDLSAR